MFNTKWDSDSTHPHCFHCKNKFTTFLRRHHCRKCGKIFCNNCMKKIITAFVIFFFTSNANASPWGSGELKLTDRGVGWFVYYIQTPGGKNSRGKGIRLTFTEDGNNASYNWCQGNPSRCVPTSITKLNGECERKYNKPCKGFAVGNRVKWLNGINTGGKEASFKKSDSRNEIVEKLIKLGFYDK